MDGTENKLDGQQPASVLLLLTLKHGALQNWAFHHEAELTAGPGVRAAEGSPRESGSLADLAGGSGQGASQQMSSHRAGGHPRASASQHPPDLTRGALCRDHMPAQSRFQEMRLQGPCQHAQSQHLLPTFCTGNFLSSSNI